MLHCGSLTSDQTNSSPTSTFGECAIRFQTVFIYIVEHINCDSSHGTDKNQAATIVHVDRIKKISRPPRFSKAEQKTITINETKNGRGVVEEVRNRTTSPGDPSLS